MVSFKFNNRIIVHLGNNSTDLCLPLGSRQVLRSSCLLTSQGQGQSQSLNLVLDGNQNCHSKGNFPFPREMFNRLSGLM